jgi:lipopolysaccharide export system permease protein
MAASPAQLAVPLQRALLQVGIDLAQSGEGSFCGHERDWAIAINRKHSTLEPAPQLMVNPSRRPDPSASALTRGARWMLQSQNLGLLGMLAMVGIVFALQVLGYHEAFLPWLPTRADEVPAGFRFPNWWQLFYAYVAPYLKVVALLGGVLFHLTLGRQVNQARRLILPTWLACLFMALWLVVADTNSPWSLVDELGMGQPYSAWAHGVRMGAMVFLCLSPALALHYYHTRLVWERYVVREMLRPFILGVVGFCALYIMWDVKDSMDDFRTSEIKSHEIALFYVKLLPYVFVEYAAAPCLLLATLLALYRMGRYQEIVSIMSSGLSTTRILMPFFVVAAYVSALAAAANFHWAHRAGAYRQVLMKGHDKGAMAARGVLYHDPGTSRQWIIADVPQAMWGGKMRRVQVREFSAEGELTSSIVAASAKWWPTNITQKVAFWSFYRGVRTYYKEGRVERTQSFVGEDGGQYRVDLPHLTETPWQVISGSLNFAYLGVPELAAILETDGSDMSEQNRRQYTTEAWHRVAQPWQALFLVLAIAPLAIDISRRRSMLGAAMGLGLFFLNLFVNMLSFNMGRAGSLPAHFAVWIPHLLTAQIGVAALLIQHGAPPLPDWLSPTEVKGWLRDFWRKLRGRRTQRSARRTQRPELRRLLDLQ